MADILAEYKIDSLKKLKQFKKSLGGTYSISQEFMNDAEEAIHEMSLSEETRASLEEGMADIKAGRVVPLDLDKFGLSEVEEKPKKKKTTRKKKSKKKPAKDNDKSK